MSGIINRSEREEYLEQNAYKPQHVEAHTDASTRTLIDTSIVSPTVADFQIRISMSGLSLWQDAAMTVAYPIQYLIQHINFPTQSLRVYLIPAFNGVRQFFVSSRWRGVTSYIDYEAAYFKAELEAKVTSRTIAQDRINYTVGERPLLLIGIDGTGTADTLTGPNSRVPTMPNRYNSHVRNLLEVDNQSDFGTRVIAQYHFGPVTDGGNSGLIYSRARNDALSSFSSLRVHPRIAIVGWSRGAMIGLWLGNDLATRGIKVDLVGLYDPVDMAGPIPDSTVYVLSGIDRVVVTGPFIGASNKDYDTGIVQFWRSDDAIARAANNNRTVIPKYKFNASHGALGGFPGYNDASEGSSYDYTLDRYNAYVADDLVRIGLQVEGVRVSRRSESEYGYPTYNPTWIP